MFAREEWDVEDDDKLHKSLFGKVRNSERERD